MKLSGTFLQLYIVNMPRTQLWLLFWTFGFILELSYTSEAPEAAASGHFIPDARKNISGSCVYSPVMNICTFLSELTIRAARSVPTIAANRWTSYLEYSTVTVMLLSSPASWFWFVSWKRREYVRLQLYSNYIWCVISENKLLFMKMIFIWK